MSALSKDTINMVAPRNLSDLTSSVTAAIDTNFVAGTVARRLAGNVVRACDCSDLGTSRLDVDAPAAIVWTDGTTRLDGVAYELDGTKVEMYEVVEGNFTADVKTTSFFSAAAAPADGDVVIKSLSEAGKADALTRAELQTAITGDANLLDTDLDALIIGSVVLGAPAGFTRVRFSI